MGMDTANTHGNAAAETHTDDACCGGAAVNTAPSGGAGQCCSGAAPTHAPETVPATAPAEAIAGADTAPADTLRLAIDGMTCASTLPSIWMGETVT